MNESRWFALGAVLLALAVAIGAFGAHGLKSILNEYSKEIYEKAVLYHLTHALGLLAVVLAARLELLSKGVAVWVCSLLAIGIVLFSGSLYVLAISGIRWLGAITPLGGSAFIAAWLLTAYSAFYNS